MRTVPVHPAVTDELSFVRASKAKVCRFVYPSTKTISININSTFIARTAELVKVRSLDPRAPRLSRPPTPRISTRGFRTFGYRPLEVSRLLSRSRGIRRRSCSTISTGPSSKTSWRKSRELLGSGITPSRVRFANEGSNVSRELIPSGLDYAVRLG